MNPLTLEGKEDRGLYLFSPRGGEGNRGRGKDKRIGCVCRMRRTSFYLPKGMVGLPYAPYVRPPVWEHRTYGQQLAKNAAFAAAQKSRRYGQPRG